MGDLLQRKEGIEDNPHWWPQERSEDRAAEELDEVFAAWRATVNMSASELREWDKNPCSRKASQDPAAVIARNLRLLETKKDDWTEKDIEDAKRTISFVARMKKNEQGDPVGDCPSKRDISLKNWAFDPQKESRSEAIEQPERSHYSTDMDKPADSLDPVAEQDQKRHIVAVEETDDEVVITYKKAAEEGSEEAPGSDSGGGAAPQAVAGEAAGNSYGDDEEDKRSSSDAPALVGRGQTSGDLSTWKSSTLTRTFSVSRGAIDVENRTVEVAFSSEAPVERGWGTEILDHAESSIRSERLQDGAPLLLEHDPSKHIGVIQSVSVGDDRVARASVRFGNSALAQEVLADVADGIKRHISVGYVIHEVRKETQEDREIYRATDWEPLEISWVSIPADHSVGIGRSNNISQEKPAVKEAAKVMSDEIQKDIQDARANELGRIKDIEALGQAHDNVSMARTFIQEGKTVDEFRSALLDEMKNKPVERAEANIGMDSNEVKRYSLTKVIRHLVDPSNARLREEAAFELEASDVAAEKQGRSARGVMIPFDVLGQRAISTASDAVGAYLVPEDHLGSDFIGVLSSHSVVFPKTTKLTGLQGDVSIPKMTTGMSAGFVANEAAAVSESDPAFGQLALSPETCGAYTDIGRKLFRQADPSVDAMIMGDLARALAVKIDQTIINGSGSSGEPTGILQLSTDVNTVSHGTNGGAETWAKVVSYQGQIQADNAAADGMCWVMHPTTIANYKTIEKATNTAQFLLDGGMMDGYEVLSSSNVPTNLSKGTGTNLHGVIFGDFSSCVVGMWGGLDLQVDPYSLGTKGVIRLVGLQDLDLGFRHEQSFAIAKDVAV